MTTFIGDTQGSRCAFISEGGKFILFVVDYKNHVLKKAYEQDLCDMMNISNYNKKSNKIYLKLNVSNIIIRFCK